MHYRHAFHAANFADVFKHVLLVGLLEALRRKDKPFAFLDTHAGAGDYDLRDASAAATEEWRAGIGALDFGTDAAALPPMIAAYRDALRACGYAPADGGHRYPGSPRLAAALARPEVPDRLVLCERQAEVAETLRVTLRPASVTTQIHVRDGYEAWSLLPPPEKRGLMLIDPPFERGDEFDAIVDLVRRASARFANGVSAAWYPIKQARAATQFVGQVARASGRPTLMLAIETDAPPRPPDANGIVKHPMTACGLVVVNPPFGFADEAERALAWLTPKLARGPDAHYAVEPVG